MKSTTIVSAGLLIASISVMAPWALADEYHYNEILIGERASGLGGAFTAISDDPSGLYYNPAGLVYGFENYISVSANSYVSSGTTAKNVLAGKDYNIKSSALSPTYFGFSQTVGKGKLAIAVIVPDTQTVNQDDYITGIASAVDTPSTLRRKFFRADTTYLIGPGYARSIGERSSIGASLLAFIRSDNAIDNQFVTYNPDPTGKYFFQDTVLDRQYYGILPKIGFQHMFNDKLAIGAAVSKRFLLTSSSTLRTTARKIDPLTGLPVSDPGGGGSFQTEAQVTETKANPSTQSPLTANFGTTWFFNKSLLVSGDLNYYSSDANFKDYKLQPVLNWALGSEWFVNESFALRGGVFTNNSNTPALSSTKTDQLDHIDMLGGSLSISFLKPGSSFSVGATYARGTGRGQAIGGTTAIQEITRSSLALTLSGSYQL
ncbi:MAG: hypothetical protein EBX52_03220 [Proteobacteria bacterium]|nr:hypothetical protein [Pseudomonadota bacterium]